MNTTSFRTQLQNGKACCTTFSFIVLEHVAWAVAAWLRLDLCVPHAVHTCRTCLGSGGSLTGMYSKVTCSSTLIWPMIHGLQQSALQQYKDVYAGNGVCLDACHAAIMAKVVAGMLHRVLLFYLFGLYRCVFGTRVQFVRLIRAVLQAAAAS